MRKYIYILFLIGIPIIGFPQAELNNYLKTGAENNPGLKAKFTEYNAALEQVPQVGALPDPTISFGYFISPIETRVGPQKAKIGINQMFPWFGTLGAKEDVKVQQAKVKFEVFEEAKSKLFFNIKSAYYDIYFVEKGIKITEDNIKILNTLQQLSLIKIDVGKSSVVDEMRVEMEINELKNQLAYLKDSKEALKVKFTSLLNVKLKDDIILPDTLWETNLSLSKDELLDSITSKNHLIKQLEHKISSWEKQVIVAQKAGLPQLSIGLDYAFIGKSSNPALGSENGRDAILLPKVGISIPLYRKKYKAMIKESTFRMEATQFQKTDKQNNLTVLFEMIYKDYKDASRRIDLYERQLKLANKSLNILLTAYSTDGKNFEEVLRMEGKVLKYALELDRARADKNASVAFVDYLIGK